MNPIRENYKIIPLRFLLLSFYLFLISVYILLNFKSNYFLLVDFPIFYSSIIVVLNLTAIAIPLISIFFIFRKKRFANKWALLSLALPLLTLLFNQVIIDFIFQQYSNFILYFLVQILIIFLKNILILMLSCFFAILLYKSNSSREFLTNEQFDRKEKFVIILVSIILIISIFWTINSYLEAQSDILKGNSINGFSDLKDCIDRAEYLSKIGNNTFFDYQIISEYGQEQQALESLISNHSYFFTKNSSFYLEYINKNSFRDYPSILAIVGSNTTNTATLYVCNRMTYGGGYFTITNLP